MRQHRPADPTDPGDAADLSIMGYGLGVQTCDHQPALPEVTFAQEPNEINSFLTVHSDSRGIG